MCKETQTTKEKQKDSIKYAPVNLQKVHRVFMTSLTIFIIRNIAQYAYEIAHEVN